MAALETVKRMLFNELEAYTEIIPKLDSLQVL